jgi:chromosome segregation ATPase
VFADDDAMIRGLQRMTVGQLKHHLDRRLRAKADKTDMRRLERKIDARFGSIDARFDSIDARFGSIDTRFERIEARLASHDRRFDSIDEKLNALLQMAKRWHGEDRMTSTSTRSASGT